jgi:hypothetical protein
MNIKQLSETISYSESSIRLFLKQGMKHKLINGKIDVTFIQWSDFDNERRKRKMGRPVEHKHCKICGKPHMAKGLCDACYKREWRKR